LKGSGVGRCLFEIPVLRLPAAGDRWSPVTLDFPEIAAADYVFRSYFPNCKEEKP